MDFRPDYAEIAALLDGQEVEDLLLDIGEDVADSARARAPQETGAGAASIHAELHRGGDSGAFASTFTPEDDDPTVYVSWDQDHYYLLFAEEGTEDQQPTPFLRPALEQAEV
jgi:HK97 gp10 family phage protein